MSMYTFFVTYLIKQLLPLRLPLTIKDVNVVSSLGLVFLCSYL
jgi:hypothetical protein